MQNKFTILILAFLLFSITPNSTSADMGPKPSLNIDITLDGQTVPGENFKAAILTCKNKEAEITKAYVFKKLVINEYDSVNNCYWSPIFPYYGEGIPEITDCRNSDCDFIYPPSIRPTKNKFRLAVYLQSQNKIYLSKEIVNRNYTSTFKADLLSDGNINIQETTAFAKSDLLKTIRNFLIALFFTLIIELTIASNYLLIRKIYNKTLLSIAIANIISLPFVWFIFPMIIKSFSLAFLLGEIFAFVFEGCFIYLLNKNTLTLKKSFKLSILINLISLIVGAFINALLSGISDTLGIFRYP